MRPKHLAQKQNVAQTVIEQAIQSDLPELQVTELPSKFLPYPKGTKIYYRPYSWSEIEYLNVSKVDDITIYQNILQGIRTTNIEPTDLTMWDFYYVALLRKISSLGTPQFSIVYSSHGSTHTKVASIEDIDFEDLSVPALPVNAKLNTGTYSFTPLTVGKYIELVKRELDSDDVALMAAQCTLPLDEALEASKKWYGSDLVTLDRVDHLLDHDLKPMTDTINVTEANPDFDPSQPESLVNPRFNTVRKEVKINVSDINTLILPFRGRTDVTEDAISFGTA